jgi:hypothetical protein
VLHDLLDYDEFWAHLLDPFIYCNLIWIIETLKEWDFLESGLFFFRLLKKVCERIVTSLDIFEDVIDYHQFFSFKFF